ncbi:MAG: peptide chain release factor aRF-1, partial [Candidatus Odinarchaeia archaeon]
IIEQMAHEFNIRVGEHANKIFLEVPNLKGIIIGGPGPTKEKFAEGNFLDYRLKDKILAVIDTGYTEEPGIKELLMRAADTLRDVRYIEEKKLVQNFLRNLSKDNGLSIYGEKEVKAALKLGAVDTVLISDEIDLYRIKIVCSQCDYTEVKVLSKIKLNKLKNEINVEPCPKCGSELKIEEEVNIVDEISELAEQTGARVEIISTETDEGAQLLNFGGIAAILRYKI